MFCTWNFVKIEVTFWWSLIMLFKLSLLLFEYFILHFRENAVLTCCHAYMPYALMFHEARHSFLNYSKKLSEVYQVLKNIVYDVQQKAFDH